MPESQEQIMQECLQSLDTLMGFATVYHPEITPDQHDKALRTAHKHALTLGHENIASWIEEVCIEVTGNPL